GMRRGALGHHEKAKWIAMLRSLAPRGTLSHKKTGRDKTSHVVCPCRMGERFPRLTRRSGIAQAAHSGSARVECLQGNGHDRLHNDRSERRRGVDVVLVLGIRLRTWRRRRWWWGRRWRWRRWRRGRRWRS